MLKIMHQLSTRPNQTKSKPCSHSTPTRKPHRHPHPRLPVFSCCKRECAHGGGEYTMWPAVQRFDPVYAVQNAYLETQSLCATPPTFVIAVHLVVDFTWINLVYMVNLVYMYSRALQKRSCRSFLPIFRNTRAISL